MASRFYNRYISYFLALRYSIHAEHFPNRILGTRRWLERLKPKIVKFASTFCNLIIRKNETSSARILSSRNRRFGPYKTRIDVIRDLVTSTFPDGTGLSLD